MRVHGEAERLIKKGLEALGMPKGRKALEGRGKWPDEMALLASLARERTGVQNAWRCAASILWRAQECSISKW